MKKTVEMSAKTREEAIAKALGELGVERHEVAVEMLDEGSQGFLGLGRRNVTVRVTAEDGAAEGMPARDSGEERGGGRSSRSRRGGRGRGNRSGGSKDADRRDDNRQPQRQEGQGPEDRSQKDEDGSSNRSRRSRGGRGRGSRSGGAKDADRRDDRPRDDRPRGDRPRDESGERDSRGGRGSRRGGRNRRDRDDRGNRDNGNRRDAAPIEYEKPDGPLTPQLAPIGQGQETPASSLLEEVLRTMGILSTVRSYETEQGSPMLVVESEDSALVIGRKGRTLQALQYLVNRMVERDEDGEGGERLLVDVEGYLERRRETLEDLALRMAAKAKRSGRRQRVKPLSPQERRIIHLALQEDEELRTFSVGDGPARCVVIAPKDEDSPRRGGRGRGSRRDWDEEAENPSSETAGEASEEKEEEGQEEKDETSGNVALQESGDTPAEDAAASDDDGDGPEEDPGGESKEADGDERPERENA